MEFFLWLQDKMSFLFPRLKTRKTDWVTPNGEPPFTSCWKNASCVDLHGLFIHLAVTICFPGSICSSYEEVRCCHCTSLELLEKHGARGRSFSRARPMTYWRFISTSHHEKRRIKPYSTEREGERRIAAYRMLILLCCPVDCLHGVFHPSSGSDCQRCLRNNYQ